MTLPDHRHSADCGCYRPGTGALVHQPQPLPEQPAAPQIIHQHIHQAPPDRTVQRLALGAGMGAGAVAAAVYMGPMLVAAMTSIAVDLGAAVLVVVGAGWAVISVVRTIGGTEGQAAAKTVRKGLRRRG